MFVIYVGSASAEELIFPKTADGIVEALSHKEAPVKQIQKGRRYKTRSLRSKTRGLGGIEDVTAPPKVGALINFDLDTAILKSDSFDILDQFGIALKGKLSGAILRLDGHADSMGTNAYNMQLSKERALAVRHYLVSYHNIAPERLTVKANGEEHPIADNSSANGRAVNRRVEFVRID